jgi:hypothetical protein
MEAAEAKPALLVSLKVLIHVHPDELYEYFGNILTIIGDSGRAIITNGARQSGFNCAAELGALSGTPQGDCGAKGRFTDCAQGGRLPSYRYCRRGQDRVIGGARRTLNGSALPPLRIWGYDLSVAAINVSSSSLQLTGKGGELGLS